MNASLITGSRDLSTEVALKHYNSTSSNTNYSLGKQWIPSDCVLPSFFSFMLKTNLDDPVSDSTVEIVRSVKNSIVVPLQLLIGIPTNVINMAVFSKLGLHERINLCLFSLSLADVVFLFHGLLMQADFFYSLFTHETGFNIIFQFAANYNLIGLYGFGFASQFMTAIIASERCFCIASPLHSQTLLKTKTMAAIIVISFIVLVAGEFFISFRYGSICVYNPMVNTTTHIMTGSSKFYVEHQTTIDLLDNIVYGVLLPGLFCAIVIITTVVTAVKLRQVVTWRSDTSTKVSSDREIALTKTLICTSCVFVVCIFPNFLFRFICIFMPELNTFGRYRNTFIVLVTLGITLNYIYSSFNFFIYVNMGSRFKKVFWEYCGKQKTAYPGKGKINKTDDSDAITNTSLII